MRFATNSVTSGNREIVSTICVFLRNVYAEYQKLSATISHGGPYKVRREAHANEPKAGVQFAHSLCCSLARVVPPRN
jgi:hypothetical protein